MAKETAARRMVYAATGLVVGVTLLWAFVFVPRLAVHPQAIADRVDSSSKIFFLIQLVATVILLVFVVVSRLGGRMIRELLYLAVVPILLHDFMVFVGAIYYLEWYQGFRTLSILMLVCVAANLIAAVLAIMAGRKLRHRSSPE
jgi:hypothetical protein